MTIYGGSSPPRLERHLDGSVSDAAEASVECAALHRKLSGEVIDGLAMHGGVVDEGGVPDLDLAAEVGDSPSASEGGATLDATVGEGEEASPHFHASPSARDTAVDNEVPQFERATPKMPLLQVACAEWSAGVSEGGTALAARPYGSKSRMTRLESARESQSQGTHSWRRRPRRSHQPR